MPTPYYEQGCVRLYHGRYDELIETVTKLHDMTVVSDPPYNVGYHYDDCSDDMSESEYYLFLAKVFSMPSVVIHYPEAICRLAIEKNKAPQRVVAWVYPSNTPRQHRSIAWFDCKPDFRLDGQDYRNPTDPRIAKRIQEGKRARLYDWWEINQVKNVSSEKTEHPCQIPEALMTRLLKITNPTSVLEPFAGSGTTLLSALSLGIPCIGFEMSERYCEIAAQRLETSKSLI